ncbi:MAG: glycosyltransferase family 4 protein [Proteobacteria bacterium]|nr:glycosyltransferase family 4 protein [Pseudomonadota bacterium]
MRILYVVRLFSGLEDGLLERRWRPRGVPTIYRMIEALDHSAHDVRFVFTCKDSGSAWPHGAHASFAVEGLSRPVTVLAGGNALPGWLGRSRGYLRELRQAWPIWQLHREFRPDVMYFDRVNIYQAALAAYLTRTPVVWRVMGVPPAMHGVLKARDPVARITRRAYRAPFAMVICSRDGSGGEAWMARALAPATRRVMMLNGVDVDPDLSLDPAIEAALPAAPTKVLFVARLVENKGCMAFMEGFLNALAEDADGLHAVIAGDGPYREPMRAAAAERGALDRVSFLGQLPHRQVIALQQRCNIYVSLNPMGNLTNANLEAMKAGACMVIPASRPECGIDTDTDDLAPESAVMRIASADDAEGLSRSLLALHRDPAERRRRSEAIAALARRLVPSWKERIDREIDLLEEVAAVGRRNPAGAADDLQQRGAS